MVHLIESSPQGQLQPKLHEQQYDKPGDETEWKRPRLFTTESAEEVAIELTEQGAPWSIERMRWKPDGTAFTVLFNQRGHQSVRLLEINTSGAVRTLIDESSPTFVHYSGLSKCWLHRSEDGESAMWTSERDGWNHLYRIDLATGEAHQLTRGPWVVREIEHVDPERGEVWFYAGGVFAGQDPYYRHLCRVGFDGEGFVVLTNGDGDHSVRWSPEGDYILDTYSRVDLPPVTELRRACDGSLICEVQRADASRLIEAGWQSPERFVAKGRDGKTDIYGILCRPTNFDPAKKYPVVEEHYAGPHSSHCPKRFTVLHQSQEFAELGFVIVQVDGMGTDHRGKAFHDVCWRNLSDGGFPDRIAWLRAASQHEPAIDLTRVGIRGTSAGGQTGMAALWRHGDFYKACVSNCGCHDNRTDKVWWNEQWMGYPIGPHYHEQSNVTNAHKIKGDLLLIVGEMDRNVPPTSTLQVVDALIRADKDFGFLFVPGAGHGARHPVNGDYTTRRTWDFLVRNLLGVEPRSDETTP
jgi:dipeptidyl aminopeptidase/acylaminoacyl peptidase